MIDVSIDVSCNNYWEELIGVIQRQREYGGRVLLHPMDILAERKNICLKRGCMGIYKDIDIISKKKLEDIFVDSISNSEYDLVVNTNGGLEKVLQQLKASPYITFSRACIQTQIGC